MHSCVHHLNVAAGESRTNLNNFIYCWFAYLVIIDHNLFVDYIPFWLVFTDIFTLIKGFSTSFTTQQQEPFCWILVSGYVKDLNPV